MAHWGSTSRVATKTSGQAEKFSRELQRLGRVFYNKLSAKCFVIESLWKSGL